jgi:hypothetical protein
LKLGSDNPTKTGIAIALSALAGLWFVYTMSGFFTTPVREAPPASVTAATSKPGATSGRRTSRKRQPSATVLTSTLDPRLHLDLLKSSEQTTYGGSGRNIFRAEAEIADIPTPVTPPYVPPGPPKPPPPPPINLRFFGFASRQGEAKRVFLAEGEDVFVAREGDIVNRRYKVLKIGNNSVEIQDVLNNNVQTIPLSQG